MDVFAYQPCGDRKTLFSGDLIMDIDSQCSEFLHVISYPKFDNADYIASSNQDSLA